VFKRRSFSPIALLMRRTPLSLVIYADRRRLKDS
jgi:hypothetical protein